MSEQVPPWISMQQALQRIRDLDTGPRRHFLILGAGAAGLAAALELLAQRHTVTIIEASQRVGGRVRTHRFEDGSYGELGAMRIPAEHDYTHHYLAKTRLLDELRPFPGSHPNGLAKLRGQVLRWTDESFRETILPLFDGLSTSERRELEARGPGGLLDTLMRPLFESLSPSDVRTLLAGDFSDPRLRALDQISWHEYLRDHLQASDDARELLGAWMGLRMPWEWSLAAILRDELNHTTDKLVEIAGGLDRLPTEMALLLPSGVIRFGTRVEGIEARGNDGGVVYLRDAATGVPSAMPFGQLLCTLPCPVLNQLPLGLRGFSAEKMRAIRGLGDDYSTATKILFHYPRRFWEEQPYAIAGGRSMTEDATLQTYYPTPAGMTRELAKALLAAPGRARRFALYTGDSLPQAVTRSSALAAAPAAPSPGVLLASYSFNQLARAFRDLGEEAAAELVQDDLRQLHPGMEAPRERVVWCWDDEPLAGRAFALTRPGTLSAYLQAAARPEGAVFFAGEHVSIAPAWIQGALESALREVAHMVAWPLGSA